jgi:flagellar capping protein FliD
MAKFNEILIQTLLVSVLSVNGWALNELWNLNSNVLDLKQQIEGFKQQLLANNSEIDRRFIALEGRVLKLEEKERH